MPGDLNTVCPHCGTRMFRWATPQMGSWEGEFLYVCFNDECPYFIRGWAWMNANYSVRSSYRYRLDPVNGETGPLPVWSRDALKDGIIDAAFTGSGDARPDGETRHV